MKSLPQREHDMIQAAISDLVSRGLPYATEVPLLNRSIDLVFQNEDTDFVAVEFKRTDWKRAIRQARDHVLGADLVYVCLPARLITQSVEEEARANGLGILKWSLDMPLAEHLPAERSSLLLDQVRGWLADRFEFRREGNGDA